MGTSRYDIYHDIRPSITIISRYSIYHDIRYITIFDILQEIASMIYDDILCNKKCHERQKSEIILSFHNQDYLCNKLAKKNMTPSRANNIL